nr:hypothetical protein [uncultured Blautia sp.]
MQKNTEYIPNRDAVSAAILQHLDGLRGIDTHCHHLPDDQFQNMGLKFLYDHSYCSWMDTYPDDAQAVPEFLLRNCSNSYFYWLPLISTSVAKRFLREALEIGGNNRILWGCDTWTSEESYGAVLAFRRVVSEVLSEMCQESCLSCEEACYTAGQIWRGNALRLFGFED